MNRISGFVNRAKGTGRPTKKERHCIVEFNTPRYLDTMLIDIYMDDDNDEEESED